MTVNRRDFLRGAAALSGAAVGASVLPGARTAEADEPADRVVVFHGAHQAGIVTPAPANQVTVAGDLLAGSRTELEDLLRTLTTAARALTAGGAPANQGISAPSADSGLLGPDVPAAGLTVAVALGSSVFDGRFGLADRRPLRLRPMDMFVNDALDRDQCDGDVLLQLSADAPDAVLYALRALMRQTRGALQPRWRADGFLPPARPTGAPRNLLGFKDGTANPPVSQPAVADQLIWVQPGQGEPAWATGGSYQVVRLIRMLVEFWDRVSITEQERMFGRRKDSGAPLTGTVESDAPDYADDPTGDTIPLDSHIRMANPRTPKTDGQRLLRRSYSYDRGIDSNGDLDMGLVFTCFQQDLDRQFVTVQRRLADEPLVDYVSPFGGGYFFALPGVVDHQDWYGRSLLA